MRLRRGAFVGAAAISAGFALLLYWFGSVDFYHRHFFEAGNLSRQYEWARAAFIPYLAWLIYAPGAAVVSGTAGRHALFDLPAWERWPLCFLAGAGTWSVLLLAIGLSGLYSKPVALSLSLAVMLLSTPHLADYLERIGSAVRRFRGRATERSHAVAMAGGRAMARCRSRPPARPALVAATAVAAAAFLLTKGLYPGGGHDYYNHYFPYYLRVIALGSLRPNEFWYHFFYSKGDGLYFLAMLLTDPLAPQLVTAAFVACAALVVFALLRRAVPPSSLPCAGVLLYIAVFIYTPGPREFSRHGGWGDMVTEHTLTAVSIFGVIWIVTRLLDAGVSNRQPWVVGLHGAVVATIVVTVELGALLGAFLSGLLIWSGVRRRRRDALTFLAATATAAVCVLGVLTINYLSTGIVLDQTLRYTWPYTNLAKVARWGVLFEVLRLEQALTRLAHPANQVPWRHVPLLLAAFLRLDLWGPLLLGALPLLALRFFGPAGHGSLRHHPGGAALGTLAWFAGVVVLAATVGGGRSQYISFYRLSSFAYAPVLCFSLLVWHLSIHGTRFPLPPARGGVATLGAFALVAALALGTLKSAPWAAIQTNLLTISGNAFRLWNGAFSLKQAYQNQQGWPGHLPWGGIYPGMEKSWQIVPRGARIWTLQVWSYCMLPDCNVQSSMSARFSPRWQAVLFGLPEQAAGVLHAEGLDYFFFSEEMQRVGPIADPLIYAPLFSPAEISKYLAIRWSDGTSYLLTWPERGTRPIDRAFLRAYRAAVEESRSRQGVSMQVWKDVAESIEVQKGQDLRPFHLPWCDSPGRC